MYTVTTHHLTKAWFHGDLEDDFVLEASENFKTRKAAKEYIERKLASQRGTIRTNWHKGDQPSYCYLFTGKSWQNENSGEIRNEYYQYTLKKTKTH